MNNKQTPIEKAIDLIDGFLTQLDDIAESKNKQTMKLYTEQPTHTCVFEKSKTSNSNEAKCKHCNNVRYLIDVVKNEIQGGNK